MNKEVEERWGYNINHVIGFPKLYPEWINLLNSYNNEYFDNININENIDLIVKKIENDLIFNKSTKYNFYLK